MLFIQFVGVINLTICVHNCSRDFSRIAAGTSNQIVHLFDVNNTNGFSQLQTCDLDSFNTVENQSICGIRFGKENSNSLFVAVNGGKVYTYDLRLKLSPVQTFENADVLQKPFACFDVNANDSVLCAGSEQDSGEAYILLFDTRKSPAQITYKDSHRDDLTQVKFHPSKNNVLASGSTDGLINVFDTSISDEDDALKYCLNTESSIQTIDWLPKENPNESEDLLSCITHTNDFQLFDVENSELIFQSERKDITKRIKRKCDCYLINCYSTSNREIILLAGSNHNGGECLRSLKIHKQSKFKRQNNFTDNKQIVRCSVYNPKVHAGLE